jgi:hypothetical protein
MPITPISSFSLSIGAKMTLRARQRSTKPDEISIPLLIRRILKAVRNVQQLFRSDHASKHPAGTDRWLALPEFDKGWRRIVGCYDVECSILIQYKYAKVSLADTRRILQGRRENN